jgi:hypothetical protein
MHPAGARADLHTSVRVTELGRERNSGLVQLAVMSLARARWEDAMSSGDDAGAGPRGSRRTRRVLALVVALAGGWSATPGCSSSFGTLGHRCRSTDILGNLYCDDGLVCVVTITPYSDVCEHCSRTDPSALCPLTAACENGTCQPCSDINTCGLGDYGRGCTPSGGCLDPLVCSPGGACLPPGTGKH